MTFAPASIVINPRPDIIMSFPYQFQDVDFCIIISKWSGLFGVKTFPI